MNKFLCSALVSLAAVSLVHAEDFYVGAKIGGRQDGHIKFSDRGVATERDASKKAVPLGVFAGYALSRDWAVEGGYLGASGAVAFDLAPGYRLKSRSSALYLAARGNWKLDDDWALFGKAGVARSRMTLGISGTDAPPEESARKTSPYLGIGVSYLVARDVALQLELEHINKLKHEGMTVEMDRLSLGLRLDF